MSKPYSGMIGVFMRVQGLPQSKINRPTLRLDLFSWPVIAVWLVAFGVLIVLGIFMGTPALSPLALIGAALICVLLVVGDFAAVELPDGTLLSPAPALLIAGLSMTNWPLLLAAVVIGTLVPGFARRRLHYAVAESGVRALAIVLIAPIDAVVRNTAGFPLATWPGLLALPVMGMLIYLVEIVVGGLDEQGDLVERLRERLQTIRWYAVAMVPIGGMIGHLWQVGPLAFVPGLFTLALLQHLFRAQIAVVDAKRALEELASQHRDRGERLEKLQALSTAMIGTLDVREMLQILCVRLAALLDASSGWVVLQDRHERLQLMASHNLPAQESDDDYVFVNSESYHGLMRRGRVVLMTDEYRHDLTPLVAAEESGNWATLLSIPLLAEKRVLGVICLAFDQMRGLDSEEQRVLTAFAHQAAITLDNARLFDELRYKQVELIQSSKLAAVGTFAAGIAHEFNNLLGSMLGYAELGHSSDDFEEKNHAFDVVLQASRRGRTITRGLLTFARRQEHQRTLADVTDAVEETLMLVELDLRKSRIRVVRELEPIPLTVCDLGQLSQVVLNLVTNARDAMSPQGGTLTLGLRTIENQIELCVRDTGCGIPAELLDKVFEPFVTTKGALGGSQTPGTGLGLSVSYGIVKEHNGTIQVESTPGNGTAMIVRLPITTVLPHREETELNAV